MSSKERRKVGETSPHMSTASLLVSVEDLINMAMGPDTKNIVNFKLLQTVLHILARQMRLLEQRVEIKVSEYITMKEKELEERAEDKAERRSRAASRDEGRAKDRATSKDEKKVAIESAKEGRKAEKESTKEAFRTAEREKRDIEKALAAKNKEKERQEKEKGREDKIAEKDKAKAEKQASKAAKDQEKADRASSKEREKEERADAKQTEREERATSKEREKADKALAKDEKAAAKEREKAEKDQEKAKAKEEKEMTKAEKAAAKEQERAEKAAGKEQEKAERAAAKEQDKAGKLSEKEQEKADREAAKEKEKAEKAAAKEQEKAERAVAKEQEKAEKLSAKEQEKADREAAKEKERAEKAAAKEQETAGKAAAKEKEIAGKAATKEKEIAEKAARGKKGGSETSIVVREAERDKEKVLVVEKGPTTTSRAAAGAPGSRANIEVVTRSQFDLLRGVVKDLSEKAAPLPMPSLPQNKELLKRLSKGTASLTDMMGAMQVNARVVAAEQAIGRMGGILTQLATAGALPEDIAGQVDEVTTNLEAELKGAGAPGTATGAARGGGGGGGAVSAGAFPEPDEGRPLHTTRSQASAASRKSILAARSKYGGGTGTGMSSARPSTVSAISGASVFVSKVTHPELDEAVRILKEDMTKHMQAITAKASASAEAAVTLVKAVAEKLDVALKLNTRISTLYSMVNDYAEQLSGFDAGISTQMQGFAEQMNQMRVDLQAGLKLLESVNNNAETAAVLELTERYENLVTELDHTLHAHQELTLHQVQLREDLRALIAAVETLREQKADRDEVQDGLRDKADNARLAGLLTEEEFLRCRMELERRLAVCHEKFNRQDEVWMRAIKDLKGVTDVKADLIQLLGLRDEAQNALQMLHQMCQNLALVLGEPKAAILTRKLTKGSVCGACMAPALMEPEDAHGGAPPRLPAARPAPAGAPAVYEEPCETVFKLPEPPDTRDHICQRWVGGSHTLVTPGVVVHGHAQPLTYTGIPTNKFKDYGKDGRLYMMEEELLPCVECNRLANEADGEEQVANQPPMKGQPA